MDITEKIVSKINKRELDGIIATSASNICYLTRFFGLEGAILIKKDGKAFCLTDSRYTEAAQKILEPLGFTVEEPEKIYARLGELCKDDKVIGFEDEKMSVAAFERFSKNFSCKLKGASDVFSSIRIQKDDYELDCIVKAQRIAEKALDTLLGEIKPGMTENECKARFEYLIATGGAQAPAFDTILISGAKTSLPHGRPGEKIIEKGDFITFDLGARVNGYRSDMTRTVAVGSATAEMKKVYDTVLCAQLAGIEAMEAGVNGRDADKAARKIIEKAGYGKYFGHSLGHGVGLDVHEAPSASPKTDCVLPENCVITVEPGIYIPGLFGVRIEDMLYLSKKQKKNLTNFSKNLIIL